ncbi:MAG: penicillin acylase family protein [Methylococcaceae bacterium]|nr:penicillin acylase family protein [Methylococcaceae bacterium]
MSKKFRIGLVYGLVGLLCLVGLAAALGGWALQSSLPARSGIRLGTHFLAPVTLAYDAYGVPAITAQNRLDAIRALAYSTAGDRLFQMDLLRRKNAGRLAEIFGNAALDSDIAARTYQFPAVARRVLKRLPAEHRQYLEAYAEGVNTYLAHAQRLPFEFTVLGYTPQAWQAEDCILIVLGMFDLLTAWSEQEERMLTVMAKTLPPEVVAFLTPDTDTYTDLLTGGPSYRPARPVPVATLEQLLRQLPPTLPKQAAAVQLRSTVAGSNAWAVSGSKTHDGRALLANDMHLGINVPNLWYRCELRYGQTQVAGLNLPGTPLIVAGSNGHIAWGGTSLSSDTLDLVTLELNPTNPDEYKLQSHWQRFVHHSEQIVVKDGGVHTLDVKETHWGPVASQLLLGQAVAIHWTALDETAVDVGLLDLETTETLAAAVAGITHMGGPQLNFLLADDKGHIAWTVLGKIPLRKGFDGTVSHAWADANIGWDGYADAQNMPRAFDPPEGFLVSANHRRLGSAYPYVIGHQFANGYRAYRISERLKLMPDSNEWSMFDLQLDTENAFYRYYQQLALSVLPTGIDAQQPILKEIRDTLLAWNGRADATSVGFALLEQFRGQLANSVFQPFLRQCLKTDPQFRYSWLQVDTPLQALLTAKIPGLLPSPEHYRTWDNFIRDQLLLSAHQLIAETGAGNLAELSWGETNQAHMAHLFSSVLPGLGSVLDMPKDPLAGCLGCVRVTAPQFGASGRLVVAPSHLDAGILHIPGGQSGHPLSTHYRDQQQAWVHGWPIALLAGPPVQWLTLQPRQD